ncbi:MAG: VWA domain-containing protein [bacterium]|nr:VWA domain-containing protein [bacterium]
MRNDLTDITLVVDRSGSMGVIRDDAQGGVNSFIEKQASEPGEALLTLVQFDQQYEFVHQGCPIKKVPSYTLEPRGSTALLDAVGRAINETGARLAKMREKDRPGLVIFVVVTDGLENASREFTRSQIREMIEHQQAKYSWQFIFLAANQDAFCEAQALGIQEAGAANWSMSHMLDAYDATALNVGRMRLARRRGEKVENAFTLEERNKMEGKP